MQPEIDALSKVRWRSTFANTMMIHEAQREQWTGSVGGFVQNRWPSLMLVALIVVAALAFFLGR